MAQSSKKKPSSYILCKLKVFLLLWAIIFDAEDDCVGTFSSNKSRQGNIMCLTFWLFVLFICKHIVGDIMFHKHIF